MDKIEPKFHVGDVVSNISGFYPNITPTISEVNIEKQWYRYKEIGGITWFKEQDKLKLVNVDNSKPPVEDNIKVAIADNNIVEDIDLYINIEEVKIIQARAIAAKVSSNIIEPIMFAIKNAAAEGRESIKLEYENYNIDDSNRNYIKHWARTCGFNTASYSDCIIINW